MPNVIIPELLQQVGLDELSNLTPQEMAADFMPAAITGLSDGDYIVIHPPYAGKRAELYGEQHFGEGRVARAIGSAALANGMAPGQIYNFQAYASQYLLSPDNPFLEYEADSSVHIYPETVTIDNNPIALPRTPGVVMDYGACLTSRSYLRDQINFMNTGHRPFAYSPLTRLHFTNQTLLNWYDTAFGNGTTSAMLNNHLYIGREDGIAGATDEAISIQAQNHAPADVVDIIVCTGAQHTSPTDLERGITNAFSLLKESGMLIVRSFHRPTVDEVGTDQITGWAYEAGFREDKALHYEASIGRLGSMILSGHFGSRQLKTVILTK